MKTLPYTRTGGKYKRPNDDPELQRLRNIKNNPRRNAIAQITYKSIGGRRIYFTLPKSDRLRLRAVALKKYWEEHYLGAIPKPASEDFYDLIEKYAPDLPRIYKEKKLPNPIPTRSDGVKEGYVYIFQDMMKPDGVYKVGSTDDVGSRLSNARTWGEFQCVYWFHSHDCKLSEKDAHDVLSEFKINKDNLGDEWFQVSKDTAINKIHSSIHGTQ